MRLLSDIALRQQMESRDQQELLSLEFFNFILKPEAVTFCL